MEMKSKFLIPKVLRKQREDDIKNICIYMVVSMWQQGEHMGLPVLECSKSRPGAWHGRDGPQLPAVRVGRRANSESEKPLASSF